MSLQEALKRMRLELGLTQAELAKKLNKAFITVNRWENGKGFPSRENAKNILSIAKNGYVSQDCYTYLYETLMPDSKRNRSAAVYGFPDIDREFLFQLADSSMNALYVIEARTYHLLYANREAEKFAVRYLKAKGEDVSSRQLADQDDRRCFHYFGNCEKPCSFCPLKDFDPASVHDTVITLPANGKTMHVRAKATRMKGRAVYVIYLVDVTEEHAQRNALYELTNDMHDGVGIYHVFSDNRIELAFMNETFYKMIGAERKEALLKNGESDLELIHPEDRTLPWTEILNSITANRDVSLIMRMRIKDGSYHAVRLEGRLIRRELGKLTYYCLFRDLN